MSSRPSCLRSSAAKIGLYQAVQRECCFVFSRVAVSACLGALTLIVVTYCCAMYSTPVHATTFAVRNGPNKYFVGVADALGLQVRWMAVKSFNSPNHRPLIYGQPASSGPRVPDLPLDSRWQHNLLHDSPLKRDTQRISQEVLVGWPLLFARYTISESGAMRGGIAIDARVIDVIWHDEWFMRKPLDRRLVLNAIPYQVVPSLGVAAIAIYSVLSYVCIALLRMFVVAVSAYRAILAGRCPRCSYPLPPPLPEGLCVCPECGMHQDIGG